MEPETHRRDREALLAGRLAVAERVRRETDEIVAVAAAKRKAFLEKFADDVRADAVAEEERRRVLAGWLDTPVYSRRRRDVVAAHAEETAVEPLPLALAVGQG